MRRRPAALPARRNAAHAIAGRCPAGAAGPVDRGGPGRVPACV